MNFNRLLKVASKNEQKAEKEMSSGSGRLGLDTRLPAPKKDAKKVGMSLAVKAFLEKREQEEKQKKEEEQRKREELLRLRGEAKNNRMAHAMASRTKDKPKIVLEASATTSKSTSSLKESSTTTTTTTTTKATTSTVATTSVDDDDNAGIDLEHLFTKNDRRQARLPQELMESVRQMMKEKDDRRRKKEEEEARKLEEEKMKEEENSEKSIRMREKAAKLAAAMARGSGGTDSREERKNSLLTAPKSFHQEAVSKFAALASKSVSKTTKSSTDSSVKSSGTSGRDKHVSNKMAPKKKPGGGSAPLSFDELMAIANGKPSAASTKKDQEQDDESIEDEEEEKEVKVKEDKKRPMTQMEKDLLARRATSEYKEWLDKGGTPPPGGAFDYAIRKRKLTQIHSKPRRGSTDEELADERTGNKKEEDYEVDRKKFKHDNSSSKSTNHRPAFAQDSRRLNGSSDKRSNADSRLDDRSQRKSDGGNSFRKESSNGQLKRRLQSDDNFLQVPSKSPESDGENDRIKRLKLSGSTNKPSEASRSNGSSRHTTTSRAGGSSSTGGSGKLSNGSSAASSSVRSSSVSGKGSGSSASGLMNRSGSSDRAKTASNGNSDRSKTASNGNSDRSKTASSGNSDRGKVSTDSRSKGDRDRDSRRDKEESNNNKTGGGTDLEALQKFLKQYEELKQKGILKEEVLKNLSGAEQPKKREQEGSSSKSSSSTSGSKMSQSSGKSLPQDSKYKSSSSLNSASTFKDPSSNGIRPTGQSFKSSSQSADRKPSSSSQSADRRPPSSSQSADRRPVSSSQSEKSSGKLANDRRNVSSATGKGGAVVGRTAGGREVEKKSAAAIAEKFMSPWDRIYNSLPKRAEPKKKPSTTTAGGRSSLLARYEVDSTDEENEDEEGAADEYEDDDEDDDDSFIDDGDLEDFATSNVSDYIRQITGYDRRRFQDEKDEDLRSMETSFAQIQKEEIKSARAGMREDIEDVKMEQEALKRKALMKKKLK